MGGMGHVGAAFAIATLVLSAAFLVWVGEKSGNPYQKMGKVFGAIALALSSLLVVGALYTCVETRASGPRTVCPAAKGMMPGPGMEMPGMGMGYRPGMQKGMHHAPGMGMGRGAAPMAAPETPEQPEK